MRFAVALVVPLALLLAPLSAWAQPCVSCWNETCPQLGSVLSSCTKAAKKPPAPAKKKQKTSCPAGQVANDDTEYHCCWSGQYWNYDTGACEGEPASCPGGRLATPTGCDAPTVLAFGGWRIYVAGPTAYVVYDGTPTPLAASFFGSSNGWWYLRSPGGVDVTVFPSGSALDGGLYGTPWEGAKDLPPGPFHDFTLNGDNGLATSFHDRGDYLEVELASGSKVLLVRRSPVVRQVGALSDVVLPKGASWPSGVAAAVVPAVPPAVPSSPSTTSNAAFGTAGRTFSWLGWNIRRDTDNGTYVWRANDRQVIAEIPNITSGNWNYSSGGRQIIVWSTGPGDANSFPVGTAQDTSPAVPLTSGARFSWPTSYGDVAFTTESDRVAVKLPDNGRVVFDASGAVTFVTSGGRSIAMPAAPAAPSSPPPAASSAGFGAVGRTFSFLGWNVRRDADNGTYVWRASDRRIVAEIPNVTSGNWNYSSDGKQIIVWSSGPGEASSFPTGTAEDTSFATPLTPGARFSWSTSYGDVAFSTESDRISVKMPDNGRVVFDSSGAVTFVTSGGRSIAMPGASAPASSASWTPPAPPSAPSAPAAPAAKAKPPLAPIGTTLADGGPEQAFKAGGWQLYKPAGSNELHAWYGAGDAAVSVLQDTNGWFYWRKGGKEQVVYPSADPDPQAFPSRPWEKRSAASSALPAGGFTLTGMYGPTRISGSDAKVLVTLSDGGVLELAGDAPTATLRTAGGRTTALP